MSKCLLIGAVVVLWVAFLGCVCGLPLFIWLSPAQAVSVPDGLPMAMHWGGYGVLALWVILTDIYARQGG